MLPKQKIKKISSLTNLGNNLTFLTTCQRMIKLKRRLMSKMMKRRRKTSRTRKSIR